MDKVKTAKDQANLEGHKSVAERIAKLAVKFNHRYVADRTAGKPVEARIDFARWIADCECGGAEYVDPDEPLFFCMACGNAGTSGRARKVEFPDDRETIEADTMRDKRPAYQNWRQHGI